MTNDIWLNLPVKDLAKSIHFFTQIGFQPNPGPGNTANSASFLVGDKKVVLMLFAQDMFAGFTRHALADTSKGSEVLLSLGAVNREDVDNYAKHLDRSQLPSMGEMMRDQMVGKLPTETVFETQEQMLVRYQKTL